MVRKDTLWTRMGITAILIAVLAGCVRAGDSASFTPRPAEGPVRVLHFPADQYQGFFRLLTEPEAMWDPKLITISGSSWEDLRKAQGDVTVPADAAIMMSVGLRLTPEKAAGLRARDPDSYERLVTNRGPTDPYDLSGLSALDANDLYMLSVGGMDTRVDPDEHILKPIAHLTGLRVLSLGGTGVTDKGMEPVRALRQLQVITFSRERHVKNDSMAVLKDLPDVQVLDLDTGVTDAGLKHVAQMPNLRWLKIRMMGKIWGPGLAELAQAPRLERLCLCGDQVRLTDRQIAYLEGLTQLKSLTLWGICDKLTDASLVSIAKLENLEELYLIRTCPKFTPAGLVHLKRLKKLKKVDFAQIWAMHPFTYWGDEVAQHLVAMPQLESIEGLCYLSAEGVKTLATLQNLNCLRISLKDEKQDYHGPTGLSHLAGLDKLEELLIATGDELSATDLAGLEQLANLKRLTVFYQPVTDDGLALIGRMKQLEYLSLVPMRRSSLNHLNGLSNLRSLAVRNVWRDPAKPVPFDEGTLDLSGLGKLEGLSLSGQALHEDDLAFLENLSSLKSLSIGTASPLAASSLRRFAKLPHLRSLWVSKLSRCTGEDLASLNGRPEMRSLTLIGKIPEKALMSLDDLSHLTFLDFHTTEPVRPETVADLRQRFQEIEWFEFHNFLPGQRPAGPPRSVRSNDKANSTHRRTRPSRGRRRR